MASIAYNPRLDGLRGAATLLLLFVPLTPGLFLTPWGTFGIDAFFVLSGYLITGILLDGRGDQNGLTTRSAFGTLRAFYLRRVLRIVPLYYLILIIEALLGLPQVRQAMPWLMSFLTNVLVTRQGYSADSTGRFWTLAVEMQFYLIWPLPVLFLPRQHLPIFFMMTFICGAVWKPATLLLTGNVWAARCLTPGCLDALSVGAVLALGVREHFGWSRWQLRLAGFCQPIGITLAVISCLSTPTGIVSAATSAGVPLVYFWLLHRIITWPETYPILAWAPLRYLGQISYSLFVVQQLAARAWSGLIGVTHLSRHSRVSFALGLVFAIWVAAMIHFLFAAEIRSLGRFFPYPRAISGPPRAVPYAVPSAALPPAPRSYSSWRR